MRHAITSLMLALAFPVLTRAIDQVEELPAPKSGQSVLTKAPPVPAVPQVVAWGLTGKSGRHYFAGGTGIADYVHDGQRHVALLEAEDHCAYAVPDANFLYYREANSGNRWALARQASMDRQYRVYFQTAGDGAGWQLFQRAQATWDRPFDAPPTTSATLFEASCGGALAVEYEFIIP
jgi:hypothetical protein